MATMTEQISSSQLCSLEKALSYQNDTLIYKLLESYNMSFEEAADLFEETKKWLWLCGLAKTINPRPRCVVTRSLIMLDKMWHTFILFTREYAYYCENYVGAFIHHSPTTKNEKDKMTLMIEEDRQKVVEDKEKEYEDFYSFVYDNLGEETLVKWFSTYYDKYTPEYINSIFIKPQ